MFSAENFIKFGVHLLIDLVEFLALIVLHAQRIATTLLTTSKGFGVELLAGWGGTFLNGLTDFQTISFSGVISKTIPCARVNQSVSVGKTLRARNEPREEVRFI